MEEERAPKIGEKEAGFMQLCLLLLEKFRDDVESDSHLPRLVDDDAITVSQVSAIAMWRPRHHPNSEGELERRNEECHS